MSGMRDFILLFVHVIVTTARLAGPGGLRSVVAESPREAGVLRFCRKRERAGFDMVERHAETATGSVPATTLRGSRDRSLRPMVSPLLADVARSGRADDGAQFSC